MRYIQRLKKAGYDFSTLPDDIQESVALLLTTTADNSKIDALDYTTLCAIRSVKPDDTEIQALYEIAQNHSTTNENNGFNTASRLDDANVLFEPESPEKKSMDISFIDYNGSEIMYSPHNDEYFVDDEPFKSLESAKEFIDKGKPTPDWKIFAYSKGLFAEGGSTTENLSLVGIVKDHNKLLKSFTLFVPVGNVSGMITGRKGYEVNYQNVKNSPSFENGQTIRVEGIIEENIFLAKYILVYFAEGGKTESSILFENNTLQIRNIGGDKVYYKKEGAEWVFLSPDELKQLKIGTKHELEHSSTIKSIKSSSMPVELVASAIAWDHITERLDYYEKLEKAIPESKFAEGGSIEPNTDDEFDENIFINLRDVVPANWIGDQAKERVVQNEIYKQLSGGSDQERKAETMRLFEKYKTKTEGENLFKTAMQSAISTKMEDINTRSREYQKSQIKDISLKISDYKNPYALNLSIEKWIDDKIGADFDNALSRSYTPEEKQFLKGYTGYGGLGQYGEISVGSMFEFFTPLKVIETMWSLAYKYGYKSDGSVLEPSCGTGEFLQFTNPLTRVVGYEINPYSAIVSKILYPHATIKLETFEKNFIANNYTIKDKTDKLEKFDLVIGNPPYGSFDVLDPKASRYLLGFGEKDFTKANNYVEYFLRRSLDLTKPGGLIVMIVGSEVRNGATMFLDSRRNPVKDYLDAHAQLLDAYRLPDSVFERTGVTSDILVIQKNK